MPEANTARVPGAAFSYADRKALEARIDGLGFDGQRLGACCNDLLHQIQFQRGNWRDSKSVLRHIGLIVSALLAPRLPAAAAPVADCSDAAEPVLLFTTIGSHPHYREMVRRVLSRFPPRKVQVIGTPSSDSGQVFGDVLFVSRLAIRRGLMPGDRRRIIHLLRCATPILWRFAVQHGLSRAAVPALLATLTTAVLNVRSFSHWLAARRPVFVLTEYDRLSWTAALMVAAREQGIPTATLQHGAIGGPCWGPLAADRIFCWGEYSQRQLVNNDGVPVSCIHRVGNVLLPEQRERNECTASGIIQALMATNPLPIPVRRRRVECLGRIVQKTPALEAKVKLHPSEALTDYGKTRDIFPELQFLDRSAGTGDALVASADVLICGNSSMALIAMHLGIPVLLFADDRDEMGEAATWVDRAVVRWVTCERTLNAALEDRISSPEAFDAQIYEARTLATEYFAHAGPSAVSAIEEAIRSFSQVGSRARNVGIEASVDGPRG